MRTAAQILEIIAECLYGKTAAELTAEECREILAKLEQWSSRHDIRRE